MITKKQKRLAVLDSQLSKTGLNNKDVRTLSKIVDNELIHSLDTAFMQSKFAKSVGDGKTVAMRRTFGKNIVIYGPTGYALVEYDQVMYCYEYANNFVGNTSFTKMTRGVTKSCIVFNDNNSFSEAA